MKQQFESSQYTILKSEVSAFFSMKGIKHLKLQVTHTHKHCIAYLARCCDHSRNM